MRYFLFANHLIDNLKKAFGYNSVFFSQKMNEFQGKVVYLHS